MLVQNAQTAIRPGLLPLITPSVLLGHHHAERPHQGKGNVILFPSTHTDQHPEGPIRCRERLGGLLKYYYRKAA